MISFSDKQKEVWKHTVQDYHRWNFSIGATRSGKTYLDYFRIPWRVRHAPKGAIVMIGNTASTLERNVLAPMREIWGPELVTNVRANDNTLQLFGRRCYALGADKASQVARLQGMGIAYCYGDEVTTWAEPVFQMLKSRLDKPGSCFDGTCNPDSPYHWLKTEFLDKPDIDIYAMTFQLDDNPFLTRDFVDNLKREYAGTVYYNRFVLGKWALAEGLVHPQFANHIDEMAVSYDDVMGGRQNKMDIWQIYIGVDIGGTKSHSTLVATGFTRHFDKQIRLDYRKIQHDKGTVDPDAIYKAFGEFVKGVRSEYPGIHIGAAFIDNAEQVIKNGLANWSASHGIGVQVMDCRKTEFKNRVLAYNAVFNTGRFLWVKETCRPIAESLSTMVYDKGGDKLLDNFTTDVDTYDADFYSWSHFLDYFYY